MNAVILQLAMSIVSHMAALAYLAKKSDQPKSMNTFMYAGIAWANG
jgi:hypothetical protein